jgi:hypothetical protein
MRDSRIESKLTQETGKGLFAMDGVHFFLGSSLLRKDAKRIFGIGKPRKNGLPYASFFGGENAHR